MAVSGVLRLLTFAETILAFTIRDEPKLDPKAGKVETSTVDILPAPLVANTWESNVHGGFSADRRYASTVGSDGKVRIGIAVTDFDVTATTSTGSQESQGSISIIDIGTIIPTLASTTYMAIPTVHFEKSASGWDDATSTVHHESSATGWTTVTSEIAHWESSASGWDQGHNNLGPQITSQRTVEVTDDPWTKDLRPSQTTSPAGTEVKEVPSKTVTDYPPPPVISHGGVTVRPIAVTRNPTVTLPNGVVTTTEEVEFQVAIGSSTLRVGTPITSNGIVYDITVNTGGSTVLHAGDLTTILPQPTAGEVRTVAGDTTAYPSISTAGTHGRVSNTEAATAISTSKTSAAKRLNVAFACSLMGFGLFAFTC